MANSIWAAETALDATSECCVPPCRAEPNSLAPVPLCGPHMRQVYEFAADIVQDRSVMALAEIHSETLKSGPDAPMEYLAKGINDSTPGYVYFIRFSDRIKIGWSSQPKRRIADLPHDDVLAVVPGTMADEHRYHQRFASQRVHGEWFKVSRQLTELIASLAPRSEHRSLA